MPGDTAVVPSPLAERFQAAIAAFQAGGAPLYAHLCASAAVDLQRHGAFRRALEPFEEEPPRRLLPHRLLACVHRAVLAGELPALADHYPTAGGDNGPAGAWPLFRAAVIERAAGLPLALARPHQHNEIGRAAALAVGFAEVARRLPGLRWRLLEVGASAGLLLHWERWVREWPDWYRGSFAGPAVPVPEVEIASRRGCDLEPMDPLTPGDALRLRSLVWADRADLLAVLDDALWLFREGSLQPAAVEKSDGASWLADNLGLEVGQAVVVFSSAMQGAGPPQSLAPMAGAISAVGELATPTAALAYVTFEVPPDVASGAGAGVDPESMVQVRVRTWPGTDPKNGDIRGELVATSDINGRNIRLAKGAAVHA